MRLRRQPIVGIVGRSSSQRRAPQGWQRDELEPFRAAFYFFAALKYAYLILQLVMELKYPQLRVLVATKSRGYLRSDWPTLVEMLIFQPTIILDGMMINVE